ncbi:MAG: baseplate J/gp47 family protein [Peptococcaceae bacterium]|nr:baseplate J/gp47 family protein [Peptococcaceae bacterium]
MIDDTVLDEIIPVPTLDAAREEVIQDLAAAGFTITNWRSGGVFSMLLTIVLRIKIELLGFLRKVLSNLFIQSAEGAWLELKAADNNVTLKQATKTQGQVTLALAEDAETFTVLAGTVFKTDKDSTGEELRYLALEPVIAQAAAGSAMVPVEAEKAGAKYNVAAGKITKCLIHLPGVDAIANAADWLTIEGSDQETEDAFRRRCLGIWDQQAAGATAARYKAAAEAVEGVLFVTVDDDHPRGQGTVDIIVTSPTGTATSTLLAAVEAAVAPVTGNYDDVLVRSSTITEQEISLTITLAAGVSQDGVAARAETAIRQFMALPGDREVNKLYRADLIYLIKRDIANAQNVAVALPAADISLAAGQVVLPGLIAITVQ